MSAAPVWADEDLPEDGVRRVLTKMRLGTIRGTELAVLILDLEHDGTDEQIHIGGHRAQVRAWADYIVRTIDEKKGLN